MEVKYKRNMIFLQARKIVVSDMKVNTYVKLAQRASPNSNNDNQIQNSHWKTSETKTKWLTKVSRTAPRKKKNQLYSAEIKQNKKNPW